jgi:hypothetical protein
MNRHKVLVMGLVAAVALVAALWSSQTRRPEQEALAAQAVVPGLEKDINAVTALRVRTAGDALQATITRTGNGWVLAERGDWPVDANVLREFLLKLSRAKRIAGKTDKPALYYKLGVEEISVKDHPGAQVEIDGLAQPVKLIVGRNVARGTGHYVRLVGEARSWQADTDLAVEKNAANWLQRDLVDIAPGRIARVKVEPPSGGTIEIVRAPEGSPGEFVLANPPRGREASTEFAADAIAGLLSGLKFDDVSKPGEQAPPAEGVTRVEFVGQDGVVVSVTSWTEGEKTWARLSATLDEEAAKKHAEAAQAKAVREHEALVAASATAAPAADAAAPPTGEAGKPADEAAKPAGDATAAAPATPAAPAAPLAVTDPAKDREQRVAALRSEVEALNARAAERSFVLPPYKAGNLAKKLEDYLKPKA